MAALVRKARSIKDLSPIEFENFTFDLVVGRGLKNVRWRTPGADGGRDIEADHILEDFSGHHCMDTWFIECKKYKSSVDWPTIYAKIAYAESNSADYLLMCTPSKFTPTAISETNKWNMQRKSLKIRLWPGHVLENNLLNFPDIQAKYGLGAQPSTPGKSVVALSLALSKTVASHHSSLVFLGENPDEMLLAAQAFADLITQRMTDIEVGNGVSPVLKALPNDQRWVCSGAYFEMDAYSLCAFLSYLYVLAKSKLIIEGTGENSCRVQVDGKINSAFGRYRATFEAISLWGDMEFVISPHDINLIQRVPFK